MFTITYDDVSDNTYGLFETELDAIRYLFIEDYEYTIGDKFYSNFKKEFLEQVEKGRINEYVYADLYKGNEEEVIHINYHIWEGSAHIRKINNNDDYANRALVSHYPQHYQEK